MQGIYRLFDCATYRANFEPSKFRSPRFQVTAAGNKKDLKSSKSLSYGLRSHGLDTTRCEVYKIIGNILFEIFHFFR